MKTIREWLNELPEPVRSRALANMDHDAANFMKNSLSEAINAAFSWRGSPERSEFWRNISEQCKNGTIHSLHSKRTVRAIIRYDIIEHVTRELFVAEVKARLDDGWELHGPPFSRSTAYCQCVVEYGEVELT